MTGVRRRRDRTARRLPPPPPPPPTATALVIRLLLICCASSAVAAARAVDRSAFFSAISSSLSLRRWHRRRCDRPRVVGCHSAAPTTTAIAASTASPPRSSLDDSISAAAPPRRQNSEHWHVWRTADELERDGISSSSRNDGSDVDDDLTRDVAHEAASILRQWGRSWAGRPEFQGLLNKSSLTHEAEESIVAIRSVLSWLNGSADDGGSPGEPVVLVDVCCGKGVLSLLASYVFANDPRVSKIVMLDRSPSLKWNHVDVANSLAKAERRPLIKTWGGCDLHDVDGVVDRLRSLDAPCVLVGIHLCKMLSPAFLGVANALGPERCPFLCLAPCCLPRAVLSGGGRRGRRPPEKNKKASVIKVRQYESPEQREERDRSQQLRNNAMQRRPKMDCYLCGDPSHSIRGCSLLPADEDERIDVFRKAASMEPCWKCGEIGHRKADCPSTQITGKPVLIKPPAVSVDVSDALSSYERPFGEYCRRLAGAVQREEVRLEDTGLVNAKARHQKENWNGERKSIFIVAS